jgi:iron complex outermembrane receptor protein
MYSRKTILAIGVSLGALMTAAPAYAQDPPAPAPAAASDDSDRLQDIVVVAQKREQRLQDVPVAVTALTGKALEANRIVNVMDLSGAVPNLTARPSAGGGHQSTFVLRGEFASAATPGSETNVATYIDGVYLGASIGGIFALPNIERIEVLRGPQGTLFGQNATAGAVSVFTPDPTGKLGIYQRFTVGNYRQLESRTIVNLPAWGPFSASIAYAHSQRRGDMKNLGGGTTWDFGPKIGKLTSPKYLGSFNREAIQVAAKFDPGGGFTATYKFTWYDEDSTPEGNGLMQALPFCVGVDADTPQLNCGFGATGGPRIVDLLAANPGSVTEGQFKRPKAVNNWFSQKQKFHNEMHILTARWRATDQLSFKNTFGYLKNDYFSINDIAGIGGLINKAVPGTTLAETSPGFNVLGPIGAPVVYASNLSAGKAREISNEFQINFNSEPVTVTAGYLHYDMKINSSSPPGLRTSYFAGFPGGVMPNFVVPQAAVQPVGKSHVKADAIYAQVEGHVTSQIDLIAGARYTWDNKTSLTNNAGVPPFTRYKDQQVSYTFGATYKPNRDLLFFAKYSKGYLAGGNFGGFTWEPEFVRSWEAGVKSTLFDRRLIANLTVFTAKYSNVQGPIGGPILAQAYNNPALQAIGSTNANIADTRATGVEFEGSAAPVRGLTLGWGFGYTHLKLLKFFDQRFAQDLTFRSKFTASGNIQYDTEPLWGEAFLSFRVDVNYRSKYDAVKFNYLPAPDAPPILRKKGFSPGTALVNGRIALSNMGLSGGRVEAAVWARNLFNERPIAYPPSYPYGMFTTYERARTFGLDVTFRY